MFCVFLQNIPPENYPTINVTHNDTVYTFSKDLSLKNSELISDLMTKKSNDPMNLDYDHEYDDFQLISDLFNYKRVFITKLNIDFLEYSANYLKIPILIKKTTKFRNHYQEFLKNPIFKVIKSLHKQIFSICQRKNEYDDSEIFSDSDDEDDDQLNDQKSAKHLNSKNEAKSEVTSSTQNEEADTTPIQTDIETKNSNNDSSQNPNGTENIQKIEYKPEYASTVAHIVLGACLADPFNVDTYLKTISNDPELSSRFHITLNSFDKFASDKLLSLIGRMLPASNGFFEMDRYLNLDTNLSQYIYTQICPFLCNIIEMKKLLQIFVKIINDDDIDTLQQIFINDENALKDINIFTNLLQFSAILSSIKCFKYFLLNYPSLFPHFNFDQNIVRSAIIGGNIEIFRLSLEKYHGNAIEFIKDSILFHRTNILKWLITNDIQFLSIYNCSCSIVLYGQSFIKQKWYTCSNCHPENNHGMCKFCAKHCHLNKNGEHAHNPEFKHIGQQCFCDDDCPLSKNIEIVGNKQFVEIDDLILLSIICLNVGALKVLFDEGAYILRCRDRTTKYPYTLNDEKLNELISSMQGYKDKNIDEINDTRKHNINGWIIL